MEAFEKWFSDYIKTITSLQQRKISSGTTKIKQLNEELLKAEKAKKEYNGEPKEVFISKTGIAIRRQEELIRKYQKIVDEKNKLSGKECLSLLRKHSLYDSISLDPKEQYLNIYTKTLKYKGRQIIGKYRFILNSKDQSYIRVINTTFNNQTGQYDHWAVSSFVPCLGDWKEDFVSVTNEGNLFGLFDLMVMYLQISGDKSVYQRIPDWFDNKIPLNKQDSEKKEYARLISSTLSIQTTKITKKDLMMIGKLKTDIDRNNARYILYNLPAESGTNLDPF